MVDEEPGREAFTASALSRLVAQQETLLEQMASFADALSGMDEAVQEASRMPSPAGIETVLGAIEQSLADLTSALESRGVAQAIQAATAALSALNPVVTVNVPQGQAPVVNVQVSPTPITVEAVMPEAAAPIVHVNVPPLPDMTGSRWEVRIPALMGGPDRVMTITRTQ
jgi:hypothetical protein